MGNRVYYTLPDGTAIDDAYVAETVERFDEALRTKRAKLYPNPHNTAELLHVKYSSLPTELKEELKPFMLGAE